MQKTKKQSQLISKLGDTDTITLKKGYRVQKLEIGMAAAILFLVVLAGQFS